LKFLKKNSDRYFYLKKKYFNFNFWPTFDENLNGFKTQGLDTFSKELESISTIKCKNAYGAQNTAF